MRAIVLTNKTYADLTELKNTVTINSEYHGITNPEMMKYLSKHDGVLPNNLFSIRKVDYEPNYTWGDFLADLASPILEEQPKVGVSNLN